MTALKQQVVAGQQPAYPQARIKLQLSLILPAHNEEETIAKTLKQYVKLLQSKFGDGRYEIVVVLNGCRDLTLDRVESLRARYPAIGWIVLPQAGKGRALKAGLELAQGELVGFVDADGQIAPESFQKLLECLELHPGLDGVIGSKYQGAGDEHSLSWMRRLSGQAFNQLVRWLLGLPFSDTQCGAKIYRCRALRKVLPQLHLTGWVFDTELLLQLYRKGCLIKEVPVAVRPESRRSRINVLKVAPQMLRDVLRLRTRSY